MRKRIEVALELTRNVSDLHEIIKEILEDAPYVESVIYVDDVD